MARLPVLEHSKSGWAHRERVLFIFCKQKAKFIWNTVEEKWADNHCKGANKSEVHGLNSKMRLNQSAKIRLRKLNFDV